MLCQFTNCGKGKPKEAQIKCLVCVKSNFYCEQHGLDHQKNVHKKVMFLDDDSINESFIEVKKSMLKECIRKITIDCNSIVSFIEKCACEAIQELKNLNKVIKNVGEFKVLRLNYRKILDELQRLSNEEQEYLNKFNILVLQSRRLNLENGFAVYAL